MKPEEAEMFKKTGGKGPGDCKGKEQCEAFCNNPDNQEICFNFAKEHGLMPAEEIEKMKEGMTKLKEGMQMAPLEVQECLKSTVGTEILDKIQAGELTPGPQIGDSVRKCFEQFMPKPQEGASGMPGGPGEGPQGQIMSPQGEFRGPGGCSSPEECPKYCIGHQEECGIPQNQQMPIQSLEELGDGLQFQEKMPNKEILQKLIPEGMQLPEGKKILEGIAPQGIMPNPEMIQQIMQQQIMQQMPQNYPPQDYQNYQMTPQEQMQYQMPPQEQTQYQMSPTNETPPSQ
jgi:hypothetical protein